MDSVIEVQVFATPRLFLGLNFRYLFRQIEHVHSRLMISATVVSRPAQEKPLYLESPKQALPL
jgi:hypothetical protein